MKKFKLLILSLGLPALVFSQNWTGGVSLGMTNYWGDLVEPNCPLFAQGSPSFGVAVNNQLTSYLGLRGSLLYGKLKGSDANYNMNPERNASFNKNFLELGLIGELHFLNIFSGSGGNSFADQHPFSPVNGSRNRRLISPYLMGGIGAGFGDPKAVNGEVDYNKANIAVPLGAGIRFNVSKRMFVGLEYATRMTFTDDIDGISELTGNPGKDDWYNFGGMSVGFALGDKDSDDDGIADDKDPCPTLTGPSELSGCPDTDGDGIADRDDTCPNEAGDQRMGGCPDRDGDGVADNVDDCPENAGLRRFSGCPDTDGDNIIDKEDNCPTVAGIPAMNGCPDADRDGITDDKDECPSDPGTGEHNGCPDTDNDGIADNKDDCPNDPGIAKFNGCADSDKDGVADPSDKCPTIPGLANNNGCPEIKAEDKSVLDYAMQNIQFRTNSYELLPSSKKILDQIAEIVKRYPGYKLKIDGYTDSQGNDFANQQLSENRAKACFDYLADKGVSKEIMTYTGHGEADPIGDNNTTDGRRKNRRTVFKLVTE